MFESYLKPPISFPTLTGSIVTFNSQYALPLKSHKIALTATQSGSGTPSPDNVRTINGYSAINISHSDADTSNPTVYTIQIGSTVYGGEYNARTGVLTVTHRVVDLGDLLWNRLAISSAYAFVSNNINDMQVVGNVITIDSLCSSYLLYMRGNGSVMIDKSYRLGGTYEGVKRITVRDDDYTSVSDFTSAVTGMQVLYPLDTPEVINLGGMEIDTLQGVNNIWADTGDTTLQYPKFG